MCSSDLDRLPELTPLNFDATDRLLIEPSVRRDTITYWLRDTALVNQDTLDVALTYLATDTLGVLRTQHDTLQILSKQPYAKRMKQAQKDYEEWKKQEDKKKKKGEPYDSIRPMPCLEPKITSESSLDPDCNVRFDFDTPLASVDTSKIHLYAKHDTLWYTANLRFEPVMQKLSTDSVHVPSLRSYVFRAEWRPGIEYSLEVDSAAFTDIYGTVSRSIKRGIKVRPLDEYGTLLLNLRGMQGKRAVVELLSAQGAPLKRVVTEDGTAQFFYIKPGKYYARLFVDTNRNGIWDTGNYSLNQQKKEMYK